MNRYRRILWVRIGEPIQLSTPMGLAFTPGTEAGLLFRSLSDFYIKYSAIMRVGGGTGEGVGVRIWGEPLVLDRRIARDAAFTRPGGLRGSAGTGSTWISCGCAG